MNILGLPRVFTRFFAILVFVAMIVSTLPVSIFVAHAAEITESAPQGWAAYTEAGGEVSFVSAADAPSGIGALKLKTADSNDSVAGYSKETDSLLSDVTELGYKTKQLVGPEGSANPSYYLGIDAEGDGSDKFYVLYETYYNGTNQAGVWQSWDINDSNGEFWSTHAVGSKGSNQGGNTTGGNFTLGELKAAYPNAKVFEYGLNMGTYNPGWEILVDDFNFNGDVSDFEPEDEGGNETTTSSETIVVTGDTAGGENQPGWLFNRDASTATPFEFNTNQHSIGNGSLYVLPIGATSSDKFIAENFLKTAIADVQSVSYDFMIGNGGTNADANQFYMNVYANFGESDANNYYDCKYDVVPTVGSTAGFTTVTFDPTSTYTVTTRGTSPYTCPVSPADMDSLSTGSSTIRAIALNVGDISSSDVALNGYLDNVVTVINEGSDVHTTTYDFEPVVVTPPTETNPSTGGGGNGVKIELSNPSSTDGGDKTPEPEGQVLGASTDQCIVPYLSDYMRMGMANKSFEVIKLQVFLLSQKYYTVGLTGVFDAATDAAVRDFQVKYGSEVLKPWVDAGLMQPQASTGYVYKTTLWKINNLVSLSFCSGTSAFPIIP